LFFNPARAGHGTRMMFIFIPIGDLSIMLISFSIVLAYLITRFWQESSVESLKYLKFGVPKIWS
jgi:hypothetical protein